MLDLGSSTHMCCTGGLCDDDFGCVVDTDVVSKPNGVRCGSVRGMSVVAELGHVDDTGLVPSV